MANYVSSGSASITTQDGVVNIPVQYNVPGIGRIGAYAGSWYGVDLRTSVSEDVMASYGLPRKPGAAAEPVLSPLQRVILVDVLERNATWNPALEPQIVAELGNLVAGGRLTAQQAGFVMSRKDDPAAAMANAFWIPAGADVPKLLDNSFISENGGIHPDALTPDAQANLKDVLAFTAEKRGTSLEDETLRLASRVGPLLHDEQMLPAAIPDLLPSTTSMIEIDKTSAPGVLAQLLDQIGGPKVAWIVAGVVVLLFLIRRR